LGDAPGKGHGNKRPCKNDLPHCGLLVLIHLSSDRAYAACWLSGGAKKTNPCP
jgi:hypothetical protein